MEWWKVNNSELRTERGTNQTKRDEEKRKKKSTSSDIRFLVIVYDFSLNVQNYIAKRVRVRVSYQPNVVNLQKTKVKSFSLTMRLQRDIHNWINCSHISIYWSHFSCSVSFESRFWHFDATSFWEISFYDDNLFSLHNFCYPFSCTYTNIHKRTAYRTYLNMKIIAECLNEIWIVMSTTYHQMKKKNPQNHLPFV